MNIADVRYRADERVTVVGKTGVGKTTALAWLILNRPSKGCVILNTKADPALSEQASDVLYELDAAEVRTVSQDPARKDAGWVLDVQPDVQDATDADALDAFLLHLFGHLEGCVLIIDEAYALHEGGPAGPGLTAWLTRGRSRHLATIIAVQRPAWVSRFSFTEADHLLMLRLQSEQDRKTVASYVDTPSLVTRVFPPFEGVWMNLKTEAEEPLTIVPAPLPPAPPIDPTWLEPPAATRRCVFL